MTCPSCQLARINGVLCHETGCPDAWRTEERECKECGCTFDPESRWQTFCGDYCAAAYHGHFFPVDDLPGESRYAGDDNAPEFDVQGGL